MKKNITILIALLLSIFKVYAQEDNTHVTAHAGETLIEQLLTDEQKEAVTHLSITGTLQDEDYAFIRSNLLKQLQELNLREADIDTIPEGALEYCNNSDYCAYGKLKIILPLKLKHLSQRSLYIKHKTCTFEVTGHFPSREHKVFYYGDYGWRTDYIENPHELFVLSDDNKNCVYIPQSGIYSADLDTLYFPSFCHLYYSNTPQYKVIGEHAYEGHLVSHITIPASVDSIGDFAFYNFRWAAITDGKHHDFIFYNESRLPPSLGRGVFDVPTDIIIYILRSAEDTYKNNEQWKELPIYPVIEETSIENIQRGNNDKNVKVKISNSDICITSETEMCNIGVYALSGKKIFGHQPNTKDFLISSTMIKEGFFLIKIDFTNGTSSTYKIKK